MITTIEQLIEKLDYDYCGFKNGRHKFTKQYLRQPKKSYQFFIETKCSICDLPYFRRVRTKSHSHVECACRETCKVRKPRRDRIKQ